MPLADTASQMHAPIPQDSGPERRTLPPDYQLRESDEEVMNALVVEDSPQIAERLVELVSVPNRVEVVATAATEDEALNACDRHTIALAIVDLQLAQGTGFGVIRRLRAATGANPACIVVLTNHAEIQYRRACDRVSDISAEMHILMPQVPLEPDGPRRD